MTRTIEDIRADMRASGECDQSWVPMTKQQRCTICGEPARWRIEPEGWGLDTAPMYSCQKHLAEMLPDSSPSYRVVKEPLWSVETKEHGSVPWPDTDSDEAAASVVKRVPIVGNIVNYIIASGPTAGRVVDALIQRVEVHPWALPPIPPVCDLYLYLSNRDDVQNPIVNIEEGTIPGTWHWKGPESLPHLVETDPPMAYASRAEPTPRERLIAEWQRINPQTPEQVAMFYTISQEMRADLDAWHSEPGRQLMTEMLVHVVAQSGAQRIVDIGCGAGHDLRALRAKFPDTDLIGVEPNHAMVDALWPSDIPTVSRVDYAPISTAQLLICIDVLEHLPDPESFLASIASLAPVDCLLFEATATFDIGTPLHLVANRGWHPGRCLESYGWQVVDTTGDVTERVRVWRRDALQAPPRGHLLLCAYRNVTVDSLQSIMALTAGTNASWRLKVKHGDSLIGRSRSILVTHWWRTTADDLFLLVDDDITFSPQDADHLAQLCREGLDIVCGAYPVRNGAHFACRTLQGTEHILFGPGQDPIEIMYAATGFLAVSRKVIDAMITRGGDGGGPLPLCHSSEPWSFYPLFPTPVVPYGDGYEQLSEDWGMCAMARRLGYKVWLDPTVILQHAGTVPISVRNMDAMHAAIEKA